MVRQPTPSFCTVSMSRRVARRAGYPAAVILLPMQAHLMRVAGWARAETAARAAAQKNRIGLRFATIPPGKAPPAGYGLPAPKVNSRPDFPDGVFSQAAYTPGRRPASACAEAPAPTEADRRSR